MSRQLFLERRYVIGLDPGRNMGFGVLRITEETKKHKVVPKVVLCESGILNLKLGNYRGGGIAMVLLYSFLRKLLMKYKRKGSVFVAYELNRFLVDVNGRPQGPDSTILYGQLIGIVELASEKVRVPYQGIPPRSIKKFVLGSGNCKKEDMKEFLKIRFKKKFKSKLDESDAIGCALAFVKSVQWGE
jgi:Holliday junction resolvasome RuvABC endonuclease subunit